MSWNGGDAVFTDDWLFTLRCEGPDRVRFLNGMLSRDMAAFGLGTGGWAVKTTHKGRIEGLVRVRATSDAILLDVAAPSAERVAVSISELLVADDCELSDATPDRDVVFLFGPNVEGLIESVTGRSVAGLADAHFVDFDGGTVVADRRFVVPFFELHVTAGQGAEFTKRFANAGASTVNREVFEVMRVESGVPRDGAELDLEVIPLEARLESAIDFDKGCYIGQEVITRASTQGQVRHILVGLDFGPDPGLVRPAFLLKQPGEAKQIGDVTSVVRSDRLQKTIGLGYIRREYEPPGTEIIAIDDEESVPGQVAQLPFTD